MHTAIAITLLLAAGTSSLAISRHVQGWKATCNRWFLAAAAVAAGGGMTCGLPMWPFGWPGTSDSRRPETGSGKPLGTHFVVTAVLAAGGHGESARPALGLATR